MAGSYQSLTYTYTVGHPIDETGFVKVVFRYAGDFGEPQFTDPRGPNYYSVTTNGDCRIEPRWDAKGHTRPWGRSLFLKVMGGFLNKGEKITVVFGDASGGSPGWRMQTFCETSFEFKTLVDPFASYRFKELPRSPALRIIPDQPVRALCIAPSQVLVNERFISFIKLEDRWGNPVSKPKVRQHPGFASEGIVTVISHDKRTGLEAESNPIRIIADGDPLRRYWGDLHGQSEETIGTNTIEDYFTFARDCSLLDFAAHQGNDFQITDEFWQHLNKVTKDFNKSGAFVTIPGYEWSGNTPLGGDRNVWFSSEGGKITRSSRDLLPGLKSSFEDSPTAAHLFKRLHRQKRPEAFVFAHVGGRYADLGFHDPKLEWGVEVHSAWGTFEWLVEDALKRGYRVGICANSDGHKGRPGASYPGAGKFGSLGGLTCVLTHKLDRPHLVEALRARHFYGTTGNRCLVEVRLITADGREAIMGDCLENGEGVPRLQVNVYGTAPIQYVDIRNGLKDIRRVYGYSEKETGTRLKVTWSGAEIRGRARMVVWDGSLAVAGNTIRSLQPINFWNAEKPLEQAGRSRLQWESITTGGVSGAILSLGNKINGELKLETLQKNIQVSIRSIGRKVRTWKCGGLQKKIEISRLPDADASSHLSFQIRLHKLRKGDNPIYIRVTQEDGHMAWSSPIYLLKQ